MAHLIYDHLDLKLEEIKDCDILQTENDRFY